YEYVPGDYAEMGIAVEGIAESWPSAVAGAWPHKGRHELRFDYYGQKNRPLVMFNRGQVAFEFTAKADPWIKLSQTSGPVQSEVPINVSIDWDALPDGVSQGEIVFRGTGWQSAKVSVTANKPQTKLRNSAKGYIEADGYIAIEAAGFSGNKAEKGFEWQEIPLHGRTLSSISLYPVSDQSFTNPRKAPYVEYPITLFSSGEIEVQ